MDTKEAAMKQQLQNVDGSIGRDKKDVVRDVRSIIEAAGYTVVETNDQKPWGAYFRFDGAEADRFVQEFFPGLSAEEARLGDPVAELSPKILLVAPSQRLSWQFHHRRAERWAYLTRGAYNKSTTDEPGDALVATPGDVVQFARSERHRLIGDDQAWTVVAEIWQHSDPANPSDEDDIVRLEDDYSR